jgi:small nuclear ribonucleoprotein (snRNP)-like protein
MSDSNHSNLGSLAKGTGLALALLFVAAQCVQAWAVWKRDLASIAPPDVHKGSLVSIMLVNGQVYYGNLVAADGHSLTLANVYYVQTTVGEPSNQGNNRLVSRQKVDWHAPTHMTVHADKLLMVEEVGAASRLRQLMEQDQGTAPAQ